MYGDRQEQAPGVYAIDEHGELTLVHEYQDGDYSLEDLLEEFGFGRAAGESENGDAIIALNAEEIRQLKVNADAYSFDYDEGFIEMCLDIERFATAASEESLRLVSLD
ncbi:MAG: hypothetical protein GTO28_16115 [Gammaproteobacteria bacterium]|nr:hypothetical protein [Gammaproteobacteria bacterium]NIM74533.1 hypothetical protein [Gammaproteobacteria bacterium]NIO26366.1 hypothetical protein [Gammaproteobacteria bacterium]NIO66918.1 hypothetical protein [Gammaproteobacteria bacterium]NIP45228.1 hypothetical protein [Gammaproteobacteria bacterium]